MLTKNKIDALYKQAILRLDNEWQYLKDEFGEEIAKRVYQTKADKIAEMHRLRIVQLSC